MHTHPLDGDPQVKGEKADSRETPETNNDFVSLSRRVFGSRGDTVDGLLHARVLDLPVESHAGISFSSSHDHMPRDAYSASRSGVPIMRTSSPGTFAISLRGGQEMTAVSDWRGYSLNGIQSGHRLDDTDYGSLVIEELASELKRQRFIAETGKGRPDGSCSVRGVLRMLDDLPCFSRGLNLRDNDPLRPKLESPADPLERRSGHADEGRDATFRHAVSYASRWVSTHPEPTPST